MFHLLWSDETLSSRPISNLIGSTESRPTELEFLRDRFEQVALDDVAHLIFAEISQLDAALQADPDFFHVVLETPERREAAIVNRLALAQDPGAGGPGNPAIGHEAAGDDTFAQLENLFHLSVTDDCLAMFRIEQPGHRFLNLIEQLVDDAVKFDLHAFAFRGANGHAFHLDVETDHHRVRSARQQNVRLRNRPHAGVNDFEVDLLALDLAERAGERFQRTLRVALEHDPKMFRAISGFQQTFQRRALRRRQFIGAPAEQSLFA